MSLFKKFTKNLNLVFPAKEALDFMSDYQALVEINVMAAKHFRDGRLSMKGIPAKLRAITDAFLESRGIETKVDPISILDDDFEKQVKKRDRTKTKAAEIEHAIRHHLEVELDDDPALQASFSEALKKILEEFANNWAKIKEELEKLRERIMEAGKEPTYGLHRKKEMPIFRILDGEIFGGQEEATETGIVAGPTIVFGMSEKVRIGKLVALTQELFGIIERELKLTGFWESIPARNRLVADLQKAMLQPEFGAMPKLVKNRKQIISRLMEVAEKNHDTILYAE